MAVASVAQLDPIKYEIFVHRLWAIGEEGRIALQRVSASPIVTQGGECMSSFYTPEGTMILACSGHLRFAAATSDAIRKMMEWFGRSPGFFDGDQIFNNDPYVAGAHTYDQMVVKPIFYEGELIAWTASSTHTADTGGLLRGAATEIYHEGIRIPGLKILEKGEFREDVFRSIVDQCRDPEYVGLDLKSRIAANNVCARRFLELVDKFGPEIVQAAGEKLIRDSEEVARAKLRSLPDGTWRSRVYTSAPEPKTRKAQIISVTCAMTKEGDELFLDLSGTDPQQLNDLNSTLPSTMAHVTIALTNQLFWDAPWSDGKMRPVHVNVPEGSILNCKFPAACGMAPWVGQTLVTALSDCVSKMLYAGGLMDDVNASWYANWYSGGPGFLYGGHNREGLITPQGLYDIHGGGLGATPNRDGVDTGGHMNIPSGGISDVERIEMQYPFVYFTRRHATDGSGFGKHRGGYGSERLLMVFESQDSTVDFRPYGAVPLNSFGLFGGHPAGFGGIRAYFSTNEVMERLAKGKYPSGPEEVLPGGWGEIQIPENAPPRVSLPEFTMVADFSQSGGGYGDPLEREPQAVAADFANGSLSQRAMELVYGVALNASGSVDEAATGQRREAIRADRRARGKLPSGKPGVIAQPSSGGTVLLHFHESLDVVSHQGNLLIQCSKCHHAFCGPEENYKQHALEIVDDLEALAAHRVPSGDPYEAVYLSYACPNCLTLLQVDVYCPAKGGETPLWDIQLSPKALQSQS